MLRIIQAIEPSELKAVGDLFRSYVAWDTERYFDVLEEAYFDSATLEREIAGLPGDYARPRGSLLLALVDSAGAGCCGMRDQGAERCEIKHLFVAQNFARRGVGKALVTQIIADASAAGYKSIRLETGVRNIEAQAMYEGLGFFPIAPYYDVPSRWRHLHVFYELTLRYN